MSEAEGTQHLPTRNLGAFAKTARALARPSVPGIRGLLDVLDLGIRTICVPFSPKTSAREACTMRSIGCAPDMGAK